MAPLLLKVYCHHWKLATELNVRIPKVDPAFTTEGFCNWKKALDRFKEHEMSHAHQAAVASHIAHQTPINQQLEKPIDNSVYLNKFLPCVIYISLAIRNDHASGSNLKILLQMVLDEDNWVQENRYQSPEIVNELIEIMGHSVLRSILSTRAAEATFDRSGQGYGC